MSEVKIPEGYKQTEVGVIPEDWEVTTIGDFSPLQRGFDLPTTQVEAGEYPVVYSNGILRTHKAFQVNGAGIVTGRSGTIGKVHYVERDFWPHNTTLWVTSFGNSNVKFVYYLFNSIGFERFKSGSGVPTLNRNDAHSFKIVVPSEVKEQIAIATALSDVDDLIKSLEKLITKKEAIKTATMQQLLSGKTRLPEFAIRDDGIAKGFKQTELGWIPEDWEIKTVFELAENNRFNFNDGDWVESEHITNHGIRLLQTGNVGVGHFVDKDNKKYISEHSFIQLNCKLLEVGDLLICRLAEPAGRACIFKGVKEDKAITSVDVTIFRPPLDNINREFYLHVFSSSDWFDSINEQVGGTTHKRISRSALGSIYVPYPNYKEQTAIANILSDMDSEIQALQKRLDKTYDIKQGMMQQLLTGKVRLVSSDSYSTRQSADNGDCLA